MVAAELSPETFESQSPLLAKKLVFITGTAAINDDFVTVTKLTTVQGCYLQAADGTVGLCTYAGNKITITNAGVLAWSGFAWGV
jgi:hypothetical protein